MIDLPPHVDAPALDPLAVNRPWRSALLWTLRDLKHSVERQRPLSLPNLCRLFERRWRETTPPEPLRAWGSQRGRAFLRLYVGAQPPFTGVSPEVRGSRRSPQGPASGQKLPPAVR